MIIGIDLGTTNSLVSVFTDDGAVLIPNALGSSLTPSAVHMDEAGALIVGASARDHLINRPDATAARFKRLMGTDKVTRLKGKDYTPEDLSSMVLRTLKTDAEAYLGETVTEAVISVPAYFNEIQRKATIHAATLAGLKVRRLINEPTAAALAYGLQDKEAENTFLIVDLGGGTFDVSILEMFSGVMEVRSSAGDAFLGGEDFTDRIAAHFAEQLGTKMDALGPQDLSRLRALADLAKHRLSDEPRASVTYRHDEEERELSLSRDLFETLTEDLTARMKVPLQRAIGDANLTAGDIDRIVLVGGATRMAPVRSLITRLFKRFPEHALDPDTVVALGAGVQAGLIARDKALDDVVMTDVCPFTLGFESSRRTGPGDQHETGIFVPLIERNTTIPASRSQEVETVQLGQTRITLNIYQGEAPYVRDNIRIGCYNVSLPSNMTEHEKVDVRFTYDSSGVLEVLATTLSTGVAKTLIIENSPGAMSPEAIAKRFKELEKIKIHPRDEAVNEAMISRLTAAYENALGQRRNQIGMLLSSFHAALATHDKRHIAQTRDRMSDALKSLESAGVFD
ncbi:Hsp70 family protein [Roseovarius nanhaiticus]|uniref:Hsp70 family protein n=1 Tax=Roseovarius nanhaiticus TaxID=573024 RepID=UPI00248FC55B|nr:molecular chaperone HscC [Roseovarius nanhaiticus]